MGTTSSERIIEDVDLTLNELETLCCENEEAIEELDDRNVHKWEVVSVGESVSWEGAQTRGKGREC